MTDEERKLASIACEALLLYYKMSDENNPAADDYGKDAMAKLDDLREELGENVYFSERDGHTTIICGRKTFYVHCK